MNSTPFLIDSIRNRFHQNLQLVVDICESEIERIFLLKVVDYILKRPDAFSIGFILKETLTDRINGRDCIVSDMNFTTPSWFGYLCGVRINNLITNTYIEIFPQEKVEYRNHENFHETVKYSLDFGMYKYKQGDCTNILKKYCVECDGYDFHNTREQISRDNRRMRNILLIQEYTTLRYLGTEIVNLDDNSIGMLLWNLCRID